MKRQRALTACVALVAASVLVAGCGGDDEKSDKAAGDKIAGAGESASTKPTRTPTPSAPASPAGGPDLSLPKDLKVVTDWKAPADSERADALAAAVGYLTALDVGIAHQDSSDPAVGFFTYPQSRAATLAKQHIENHVKDQASVTGTERLHRYEVDIVRPHSTAVVSFCVDDSRYYGKDVKTGEVHRTEPGAKDHTAYEFGMRTTGAKAPWRVWEVRAETSSAKCQ
ncbi:hypothetical protein ACQYWQ_18815 [Streptomyces sp. P6-2-1]|uniref:hypothetical protein n=1 Tax=Streptomyces sp. P6-2-1 TaxID=3422591 RepID=UPI003D35AEB3